MLRYYTHLSGECVELNNQLELSNQWWCHGYMIMPMSGYIYWEGNNGEIKVTKKFEDNLKDVTFIPRYTKSSSIKKYSSELPLKLHFQVFTQVFEDELSSHSDANAIGELSYEVFVEFNKFDEERGAFVGRLLEHLINDK